ncbi:TetR/AcrR family transcriptional regulator [Scleromatobacter humisilvae]|uniref:TetR/AcrR family transcriptional regulator n=1 Tax=Scleromatobacter humisilvae TaxID=2897159 RepID=A0A9X1YJS8_9BURK|nr:TetR/AcrR family transcriptional regulator [Scleromatobacter humisilvae]MCK9685672.1 TetR/AcrR family transcriptional regulator [Scleromatobacter humisilvae]
MKHQDPSPARPRENLYGQKMGRKGAETRARLMKATTNLLEKRSIRDLSVSEIAAVAGTSSSAFYVYFDDVNEIALAIAESVQQITPEIEALLTQHWSHSDAKAKATALIKAYAAFWHEHHAILRVRNLAADEGEKRFEDVRHASVSRIHELLCKRIAAADNGLDPASGASAVLVVVERVATIARLPLRTRRSSRAQLIQSAAFMVAHSLTPPEGAPVAVEVPPPAQPRRIKSDGAASASSTS